MAPDPMIVPGCAYQSYSGNYDLDWAVALLNPIGVDHRAVVCLDPAGLNLQLTCELASMRPLTQERDVKFQEYQGQDIDIEFVDPDGDLDPAVPGSLLDGVAWRGMKLAIGSWIVGTVRVLAHGVFYLDDIRAKEGAVTFRAKDAFARLKDIQVRANEPQNLVAEIGASGTLDYVTVDSAYAAIESWTITFTTATHFTVAGSLTGPDGEGDTTADFRSISGSILIAGADWDGVWVAGDTLTFITTAARFGPENLFNLVRNMLIFNSDLEADDFDAESWDQAVIDFPSHIGSWIQREPIDALSLLRLFMRHGPATAYPDHEGKIAVAYFIPQLGDVVNRTICGTYDLESLDTERLESYTSVTIRYAPDLTTGEFTLARRWPIGSPGNRPLIIELAGFEADDESLVDFIAQRYFALLGVQREVFNADLLLEDLNRLLEDIAYVRSDYPRRAAYGQFFRLDKDLMANRIRAQLVNVTDFVQPAGGACGFLFWNGPGHRFDDCWVFF